jgi:hypothetical protein
LRNARLDCGQEFRVQGRWDAEGNRQKQLMKRAKLGHMNMFRNAEYLE